MASSHDEAASVAELPAIGALLALRATTLAASEPLDVGGGVAELGEDLRGVLAEARRGVVVDGGVSDMRIGVRTDGTVPPSPVGRSRRMPRAITCGSAKTCGDGVDRTGGNAGGLERGEEVGAGEGRSPVGDQRHERRAMLDPAAIGREAWIVGEIRTAEHVDRDSRNWPSLPTAMMTWPSATGKDW